ncbi:MAG TPA: DUF308 domain-containing protein [Actinomycetota bacterium]|nr:DUF308 domain-containing protein [Actinomycetota bacterium]
MLEEQDVRLADSSVTSSWWLFLIAGLAWLVISVVVLAFNVTSVATVGVLLGAVFLVAGVDEFLISSRGSSWAWAHILLGILFVLGAIWSFASPIESFRALASVFGILLIFGGTLDIVQSAESRIINPLWGLGVAAGILEILLGFWASQQFFPARAALLLVWVGFFALFRGISEIVLAFEVHSHR